MCDIAQPTALASCVSARNNIGLNPADPAPARTGHTAGSAEVPVGRLYLNVGEKLVLSSQEDVNDMLCKFLVTLNVAVTVVIKKTKKPIWQQASDVLWLNQQTASDIGFISPTITVCTFIYNHPCASDISYSRKLNLRHNKNKYQQ